MMSGDFHDINNRLLDSSLPLLLVEGEWCAPTECYLHWNTSAKLCSQIGPSYTRADHKAGDNLVQFSAPRGDSMQGDIWSLRCDQDICGKKEVFRSFC